MKRIAITDRDTTFAYYEGNTPVDAISRFEETSPDFYHWLMEIGSECAELLGEVGSPEHNQEWTNFLTTLNFFLLGLWSANGGRLPKIPSQDFSSRLEKMGRVNYLLKELAHHFQHQDSFHFLVELYDQLNCLHLFTRCHLIVVMCIVMEAFGNEMVG